jgi:hypothetical protein
MPLSNFPINQGDLVQRSANLTAGHANIEVVLHNAGLAGSGGVTAIVQGFRHHSGVVA